MPTDLTDAHPASAVNTCGAFSHLRPQAKRRMLSLTRLWPFLVLSLFAFALLWPLRGNTRTPKPFALRSGLAFYRIGKRLP